ncbi:hypothetical protein GCM10023228_29180 [Brevibacillus fulvus]
MVYLDKDFAPREDQQHVPVSPTYSLSVDAKGSNPADVPTGSSFVLSRIHIKVGGVLPGGGTIEGDGISLIDIKETKDNGYPMITEATVQQWEQLLGSDYEHVRSRITRYEVHSNTGANFVLYSLSELINISGGRGLEPAFEDYRKYGTPPHDWVKYIGVAEYQQTRVPTASITLSAEPSGGYKVGQPILITGKATAYSAYERFVIVDNFSVMNKTTNDQYTVLEEPGRKEAEWTSGSANKPPGISFTPQKPGTYLVSLAVTDYHRREAETYPVTVTFQVGAGQCRPLSASLTVSGEPEETLQNGDEFEMPDGKNTIQKLIFPVAGTLRVNGVTAGTGTTFANLLVTSETDLEFTPADATYCLFTATLLKEEEIPTGDNCDLTMYITSYSDGGEGAELTDTPVRSDAEGNPQPLGAYTDYMHLDTRGVEGTFFIGSFEDGEPINDEPASEVSLYSFPTSGTFYLSFLAEDGSECWVKAFYIQDRDYQGEVQCPVVHRGNDLIRNGEVLTDVKFKGSLSLHSTFVDEKGITQAAEVYWHVKKPDGTVFDLYYEDKSNGNGEALVTSSYLDLPAKGLGGREVAFDQVGTYEISYSTRKGSKWEERNCEPWKIQVVISICSVTEIEAKINGREQPMGGTGLAGDEYTLRLTEPDTVDFKLVFNRFYTNYKGDWDLKEKGSAVSLARGNSQNPFSYTFTKNGSYVLTLTTTIEGGTCVKTVFIEVGLDCDDLTITGNINGKPIVLSGTGTAADPFQIELNTTEKNELELSITNGIRKYTALWTLYRGGEYYYDDETNHFTAELRVYPQPYTITVETSYGDETCTHYIEFVHPKDPDLPPTNFYCSDLDLFVRAAGEDKPIGGSGKTPGDPYLVPIYAGQDNTVRLAADVDGQHTKATFLLRKNGSLVKTVEDTVNVITIPDSQDVYTVEIQVKSLDGTCYLYVKFVKKELSCDHVYLHFLTGDDQYFNVAPGPGHVGSVTIQAESLDEFALMLTSKEDSVETAGGSYNYGATFESSLSNDLPDDFADKIFAHYDTKPGTYTFKIKVNDPLYPALNGCTFTFTLIIDPESEPTTPGGVIDGGQMSIHIYDSKERKLVSASDGVWEREPARIEVEIDQTQIDRAFRQVDQQIDELIREQVARYERRFSADEYENVQIDYEPRQWNSKTSSLTAWPESVPLKVTGPGVDQTFRIHPKRPLESNVYTGTIVPTQTTWQAVLQTEKYLAEVEAFSITVPYEIQFAVTYAKCERDEEGNDGDRESCVEDTIRSTLNGTYTIQVKGAMAQFEVFEPNASGSLLHTAEWSEYHSRDRYLDSKADDFYAGERILTRINLTERHRHPFSGQFPEVVSAQSWISETGQRNTPLQSVLKLTKLDGTHWGGAKRFVEKLGNRELGVDNALMGDKQLGFKQGGEYAVYFQVSFSFGVTKGYGYPDKSTVAGHEATDYRLPFRIIANAWERQGIRNHTTN